MFFVFVLVDFSLFCFGIFVWFFFFFALGI